MMKNLFFLVLILCLLGCKEGSNKEIYQSRRDNIVNVKSLIKEIDLDDVLIGSISEPYSMGDFLVIGDYKSVDKMIHLFDGNKYKYLASVGDFGQGPKEITNLGNVVWNEKMNEIYVTDHGKLQVFGFSLDSIMNKEDYKPFVKIKLNASSFPNDYVYINDTLSYGTFINPTSSSTFIQSTGTWNMNTGEIKLLEYNHPDIEKKRISLAVSMENQLYAECNSRCDLISIFDLRGNLIRNIYGPKWGEGSKGSYFTRCLFARDYLIALYDGNEYAKHSQPTQCQIFTKEGDYVKTLETDSQILRFCYDKINNRLIFCFNDEIQYGYLDLNELLL